MLTIMKKINKSWASSLIVMGCIAFIANGCSLLGWDDPALENPIITWENPVDISFGTPLSAVQLNATANVSGTFNYSPGLGTVLSIGANQNLQVTFSPDDERAYNSVNKTVKINIVAFTYGTLSDADGNVYKIVTIGTQTWMAENLKTTKFNDNTSIPLVSDETEWNNLISSGYCWYNNDAPANKSIHGALYNWYSVNTGKLCPVGWHVPLNAEWTTLSTFLGGDVVAAGKLKEAGTTHWTSNSGSTNSSGFTALPSGVRVDGTFLGIGEGCYWWSATENGAQYAFLRGITASYDGFLQGYTEKTQGRSVRCIKN